VVQLDSAVRQLVRVKQDNLGADPAKACLYVGMTGLDPEERFQNHKKGLKAARVVRDFGAGLMPELYEHLNPMPFEAALQMEMDLAEDLRSQGYTVTGGH
jgi:predicted GIY-YIG superfamily endonuclease